MKCAFCCVFFSRPRLQQSVAPRLLDNGSTARCDWSRRWRGGPSRPAVSLAHALIVFTRAVRTRYCHRDVLLSSDSLLCFVTFCCVIHSWTICPSALWQLCLCPGDERVSSLDPLVFLPCRQNLSKFGSKTEIPSRSIRWRWTTATAIWKVAW